MLPTDKVLRHKVNKEIFGWNKPLAESSNIEEITLVEAYPEQFVPEKQKSRKTSLQLESLVEEPPVIVNEQLNIDASRNLPQ
jgi:hypothetical protein